MFEEGLKIGAMLLPHRPNASPFPTLTPSPRSESQRLVYEAGGGEGRVALHSATLFVMCASSGLER